MDVAPLEASELASAGAEEGGKPDEEPHLRRVGFGFGHEGPDLGRIGRLERCRRADGRLASRAGL
jgi:hypothetical protein